MTMRQNTVRAVKGESTIRRAAEKFCRNKLAVISLIILLVLILLAIFRTKSAPTTRWQRTTRKMA